MAKNKIETQATPTPTKEPPT